MSTDNRHPRIVARCSIMADPRLSFAARCLYHLLDDLAFDGICRAKQTTLGIRLQISTRYVRELLAELAAAGHLVQTREKRLNEIVLRWSELDSGTTVPVTPEPQFRSGGPHPLDNQSCYPETSAEFSTNCCYRCGNTGTLGENYLGEAIPCDCRRLREVG